MSQRATCSSQCSPHGLRGGHSRPLSWVQLNSLSAWNYQKVMPRGAAIADFQVSIPEAYLSAGQAMEAQQSLAAPERLSPAGCGINLHE